MKKVYIKMREDGPYITIKKTGEIDKVAYWAIENLAQYRKRITF